jgi:hypothetical protein
MPAATLLRLSSQLLQSLLGGLAVFCLFYAAMFFTGTYLTNCTIISAPPDYRIAKLLLMTALLWGGLAIAIVYLQGKYLSKL